MGAIRTKTEHLPLGGSAALRLQFALVAPSQMPKAQIPSHLALLAQSLQTAFSGPPDQLVDQQFFAARR
ncbi:MAG: hypothetical protein V7754_19945 [Halioglobus sp.]